MNDHLPECEAYRDECGGGCICHHVRACEQRCDKKGHAEVRAWSELSRDNFDAGYSAGLDAARKAVIAARSADVSRMYALDSPAVFVWLHDALAAIDALREEQK